MTTNVDICNLALLACGTRSDITSLTEASPEARACNKLYNTTLGEVFEMAKWSFGRTIEVGTLIKSMPGTPENPGPATPLWSDKYPHPPWAYEYNYPLQCAKLWYVVPQTIPGQFNLFGGVTNYWSDFVQYGVPFIRANSPLMIDPSPPTPLIVDRPVICTNQANALFAFVKNVTDPNLWGATFRRAVISQLAFYLAIPLRGDKELAKINKAIFDAAVLQAKLDDANEGLPFQEHIPDWLTVRDIGNPYSGIIS